MTGRNSTAIRTFQEARRNASRNHDRRVDTASRTFQATTTDADQVRRLAVRDADLEYSRKMDAINAARREAVQPARDVYDQAEAASAVTRDAQLKEANETLVASGVHPAAAYLIEHTLRDYQSETEQALEAIGQAQANGLDVLSALDQACENYGWCNVWTRVRANMIEAKVVTEENPARTYLTRRLREQGFSVTQVKEWLDKLDHEITERIVNGVTADQARQMAEQAAADEPAQA